MGFEARGRIGVENVEMIKKKGLYPEEQLVENHFSISLEVFYLPAQLKAGEYLNYERLIEIIQTEMDQPEPLLENLAKQMLDAVFKEWAVAEEAHVCIRKLNPAFVGKRVGALVVSLNSKKHD